MRLTLLFCFCILISPAFGQKNKLGTFSPATQPAAPDYSLEKYWSALPFRADEADIIPKGETWLSDSLKEVDVFYIYPTIYEKGKTWCADVNDKKLNRKIDKLPVHFQASVFNASCRVYAPRYRQGIIDCFFDTIDGTKGLDFAYQDVKRAFKYYLEHYNHGRPIIIASHSQGSTHSIRLLREFFDTTALRRQLVCSYSIGMGIDERSYKVLKPCSEATQTGCYVTWASFRRGYDPGVSVLCDRVCVNPISWTSDSILAPKSATLGGVLFSIRHKRSHAVSAQRHCNYLWIKTSMPLVPLLKVMHVMDYNLFWFDIRKNVADRVKAYLKK